MNLLTQLLNCQVTPGKKIVSRKRYKNTHEEVREQTNQKFLDALPTDRWVNTGEMCELLGIKDKSFARRILDRIGDQVLRKILKQRGVTTYLYQKRHESN